MLDRKNLKRVAVSQQVDIYPDRRKTRDALDQNLVIWLRSAGYMAYPVPNVFFTDTEVRAWLHELKPCGLVLSGGEEIGTMRQRDFTEEVMIQYAEREKLPLLGIGRGMQMMARQSLVRLVGINGHVRTRHRLTGEIQGEVNSYHDLALSECPSGYQVLARSEDCSIEAIQRKDLSWEGWMWHPEQEESFDERDVNRLRSLFG